MDPLPLHYIETELLRITKKCDELLEALVRPFPENTPSLINRIVEIQSIAQALLDYKETAPIDRPYTR